VLQDITIKAIGMNTTFLEGFLVGVNAIPILPFISDTEEELEKIIGGAKQYGADYILVGGLTLFGSAAADSKTLFFKFLERYDRALIAKYNSLYGINYFATRVYQDALKQRADKFCKKHGIRNYILIV